MNGCNQTMDEVNIESIEVIINTFEHSLRTSKTAYQLAKNMGLSDVEVFNTFVGALLHDVGKLNLDQDILSIPNKLTNEQYEYIKYHALFSYKLTKGMTNEDVRKATLHHHERLNGSGYWSMKDIDIGTQIIAIADVYDALIFSRCYREEELSHDEAIELMKENKGFNVEILDLLDSMKG